jgi:sugar/nucleoside kinase (ribokinase family)
MNSSRQQICASTSQKIVAALPTLNSVTAMIGLDGFVDEIIAVVDKRFDAEKFAPVPTIQAMAEKILRASGQSSNYEMVVKQTKLGGNGPIMANALAQAGMRVTYIGNLGHPNLHPVFEDFAKKAQVFSIADPGHTDALEFDDGKLMLGKYRVLSDITWDRIVACMGELQIKKTVADSKLIAMTNWTMIPHIAEIWAKLAQEISRSPLPGRLFFVDLADPEKRTREDIESALQSLKNLQNYVNVILGLNLKEATQIAAVLGSEKYPNPESAIEKLAAEIRQKLNLFCVVIHPRRGAAAATPHQTAQFDGPFVIQPKISTGAGDHFNAGFCLAQTIGLNLEESLAAAVASSGYYVRTAQSATGQQLADFLAQLPQPQSE